MGHHCKSVRLPSWVPIRFISENLSQPTSLFLPAHIIYTCQYTKHVYNPSPHLRTESAKCAKRIKVFEDMFTISRPYKCCQINPELPHVLALLHYLELVVTGGVFRNDVVAIDEVNCCPSQHPCLVMWHGAAGVDHGGTPPTNALFGRGGTERAMDLYFCWPWSDLGNHYLASASIKWSQSWVLVVVVYLE